MKVSHSYVTPGEHEVTLTVTSGGKSDDFRFLAESTDPRLLSLRLNNGNPDDVTAFDARVTQDGTRISQSGGIFTLTDHEPFHRRSQRYQPPARTGRVPAQLRPQARLDRLGHHRPHHRDQQGLERYARQERQPDLRSDQQRRQDLQGGLQHRHHRYGLALGRAAFRRCGRQGDVLCRRQGRGQRRRLRSDAGLSLLGADGREPVRAKLRGQPAEHRHLRERRGCRRQLSAGRGREAARHPSPARSRRPVWTSG